jgi:hypothetical protein
MAFGPADPTEQANKGIASGVLKFLFKLSGPVGTKGYSLCCGSGSERIRFIFRDQDVLGSGSVSISYYNEQNKINWNLTESAFWLCPVGPTDKENQVEIYKSTLLGILPLQNGKDPEPQHLLFECKIFA